jgi:diaminopimelate decarboxylase
MNHFGLRDGRLFCEDVPLAAIAEAVGTPVYVYASATLDRHYRVFREAIDAEPALAGALVAFAVKANSNLAVLATLARLGAGADTVSEGEIRRALAAGIPAGKIVFSGVGKTAAEIAFALAAGVRQINAESEAELALIEAIAQNTRARATIAIRINPDIGAGGHAKITTGAKESKFGVSIAEAERLYALASASPHLAARGLACHIGSQITDLSPLRRAFGRMRELTLRLRRAGMTVERLDLGGGLGVPYFDSPDPPGPTAFAAVAAEALAGLDVEALFEPGRVIAANAGVLLATVLHVHARPDGRRFLVLDAAMNDLMRPALYESFHDIRPLAPREGAPLDYDVVGPVCETADTFARARRLRPLHAGDRVAFMTAGAYAAVMAGEYNSRPLVPEVLVRGDVWSVVRSRPSYEEMLGRDRLPSWLASSESAPT